MVHEAVNCKDVLTFLRNICRAHRSGAFGGKEALWDFLKDVGQNLNMKSLQKSYAEDGAKHEAQQKANVVKNMELIAELVSAKSEGRALRLKEQQGKWGSDRATLTRLIESLRADKHEALHAKESLEMELKQTMAETAGYKKTMDSKLEGAAVAQLEKDRLNEEISTLKFSLERAEKNQLLARQELASVRVQLRRFQIQEGPSSARDSST
ncbi:hypothetical protein R1sor_007398 [Riccia sorocarpa]|uniref:Uncharacterized protein n=1 Tax=Riccia sorocarpa TaxID=122646 RepID=A0ABD3HTU9_9MARC